MKFILRIHIVLSLVITNGFSQNLISNGDFEANNVSSWGGIKNVTVQSTDVNTGVYAAELINEAYFSQSPNPFVEAGKTYKFTCFSKANVAGDNAYMSAQYKPSGSYEYLNYVNIAAASWTKFSFVVHLTPSELNSFRLGFYKPNGSSQQIDDIEVVEIDATTLETGNSITATSIGILDDINKKIIDINQGSINAQNLLNALTLSTNATAIVVAANGKYTNPNGIITSDHKLRVFAENGTFQSYTIETANKTIKSIINGDEAELDNTNFIVSKITPVITVSEFKNIIELYEGATLEVLDDASKSVILNQSSTLISESMMARVTGSNGFQDYALQLRPVEMINTILSIDMGTINESTPAIEDIANGIKVVQLNNLITVATYATFQVINSSGTALGLDDVVTTSDQVRVTAEDGSIRIYSMLFGTSSIQDITYTDQKVTENQLQNQNVTLEGNSELKIISASNSFFLSTVNINSEDSWLMFQNVLPSVVRDNYLDFIKAYGQPAVLDQNVRIVQYIDGAVVIPHTPDYGAVEVFDGPNFTGNSMKLTPYTYNKIVQLGSFNNAIASFKVKRGYYVTMAQNEDGTGYSKVFIAHDSDLVVNTMPLGLENAVSFARVIPWRWPHKKGHPNNATKIRGSWSYNWGAGKTSTLDEEFIPIRHNLNWPSYSNFTSKQGSTSMLGHNEPDRPDQANATVEQVLAQWPKLMESGLRIGSPAPSDGGLNWLYEFIDKCDELNYRVDYVAVHYYRGCQSAAQFKSFLQAVHGRTGRPIWVTEWNNGANWTNCKPQTNTENAVKVDDFIQMMDNTPFVERYCIFPYLGSNWDTLSNGNLTATGIVLRDNKSPMAFNPIEEYANPFNTLPTPTNLTAAWNSNDASVDLTWNDVSDYENGIKIERKINNGNWQEIARIETANIMFYKDKNAVSFGDYKYRVRQMIVGAGNSSYSNIASVTAIQDGDENVALGKLTTTSTDRSSSGYIGSKAVDGDIITNANRWLTASGANYPHWIEIDLNGSFEISGLKIYTGYNGYGNPINDFKFQYWNGNSWINALNVVDNTFGEYISGFTRVETSKVRLYVTKADANTVKLFEIQVYGKVVTLGIDDINLNTLISLYPNPVNDVLNIKGYQHISNIELYNALGVKFNAPLLKDKVDVSHLTSGLYFLTLNKKVTYKFIKK